MSTPVTDDPDIMRDLVHRYMEDETPDPELYEYVLSLGIEPPEEIRERNKASLFHVRFPPGSEIGSLEWD